MGFWNFFKGSKSSAPATEELKEALPEIKREDPADLPAPPEDKKSVTIDYGTGMPIDLIYAFLKEDYETKGYDDALCNPDNSYKEMNKILIRSNFEIKLKQIILRYTDDLRDISFHIESRSQAGLTDIVDHLRARKEMLDQHMGLLNDMHADLKSNSPYMIGMLMSYERGFLRGLAALSLETLKPRQL